MKKKNFLWLIIAFICTLSLATISWAEEITINVPARELCLVERGNVVKKYPIAVGKNITPTPLGQYSVVEKIVNPTWVDPENLDHKIPSGASNPLGYRWIGIGGNYGIHGTIAPSSIGKAASNGCIRMMEKDVEDLYRRVKVGTAVKINYDTIVVGKNKQGAIGFTLHPDIYGRKSITPQKLYKLLQDKYPEIMDFVSIPLLNKLIKQAGYGHFQVILQPVKVIGENQGLTFNAYEYNYVLYLPLAQVAHLAKTYYQVEDNKVITDQGSAPVQVFNNRYYLPLTSLRQVFPLHYGFENKNIIITKGSNYNLEQYPIELTPLKQDSITRSKALMDDHIKRLKGEK